MAPSTPYVAEELWERLGGAYSVHTQTWPVIRRSAGPGRFHRAGDSNQRQGPRSGDVAGGCLRGRGEGRVRASEKIAAALMATQIVSEIYVPGRLMNFVVKPK